MRIVVIEDEVLVRKGIVSGIEWEKHGVQVVGEAADGLSGLELVRKTKPDIVLTDIKMPIMDGLEMIRCIRREQPETAIMILSVREDFQSVQEALRLGVIDYVHKLTMSPEELLDSVLKIKGTRIRRPTGNESSPPAGADCDDALWKWLQGEDNERFDRKLADGSLFLVAKVHPGAGAQQAAGAVKELLARTNDPLLMQADLGEDEEHHVWLLVVGGRSGWGPETIRDSLTKAMASYGGNERQLTVGLSLVFHDKRERTAALEQAAAALRRKFYKGCGGVHTYSLQTLQAKKGPYLQAGLLKEYLLLLEHRDDEAALAKLNELFPDEIDEAISPQRVRDDIFQWQSSVLLLLNEWGGGLPETLFGESPFEKIAKMETYPELRDWCFRLHTVAQEMLRDLQSAQPRAEIQKSIQCIRTHYNQPLRVQDVAAKVNLSENYFSYLFTKHTGKTFIQFVQETRVAKAKELLRESDNYWFTVGEQVGFDNPKYFAKIFKKFTKLTTAQYKKSKVRL